MKIDAFTRCKNLGGRTSVKVIDEETGEKREVCEGAIDKKTKKPWGAVASSEIYGFTVKSKKKKK